MSLNLGSRGGLAGDTFLTFGHTVCFVIITFKFSATI